MDSRNNMNEPLIMLNGTKCKNAVRVNSILKS